MSIEEINRMKLHDAFVRGNCQVGIWTQIEHFEFGTPREPIEAFYKRIKKVDERAKMCRAIFHPEQIKLAYPN